MSRDPAESAEMPVLASAEALEAVPGYSLVRFLGESALTRAYECRADRTGELVVVKVFNHHVARERALIQRIQRDNRLVSGVRSHPHIARVVDVGEAQAGPWLAVERLQGRDLRSVLLTEGALPMGDALAAARDVARALEAAAGVGLTHRNLKPSNLFWLEDGTVKVTDFGLAGPLSRFGGPEGVFGEPSFVAPELLRGATPDIRSDLYALGATLFQLITGSTIFDGSPAEILAAHQKKPVPSIATLVPNAGIVVVDAIYRLLQKDPARRPQTASEALKLLEEAASRNPPSRTTRQPPASVPPSAAGGPSRDPRDVPPSSSSRGPASGPSFVDPHGPTRIVAAHPFDIPSITRQETAVMMVDTRSPFDAQQDASGSSSMGAAGAYAAQPTGVLGTLKQLSVAEILQMLEIGKKSARVEIQLGNGTKGVVFVHDGQIVNCAAGPALGEAAVVFLCRHKEGYFRIHYEREECERNVQRPTTFVLLEAMRQIDEASPSPPELPPVAGAGQAAAPLHHERAVGTAPSPSRLRAIPLDGPATAMDGGQVAERSDDKRYEDPTAYEPASRSHLDAAASVPAVRGASLASPGSARATLARAGAAAGAFIDEKLPRMEAALRRAAAEAGRWIARADRALEPLRPSLRKVHPGLGEMRPIIVVSAVLGTILALVLGVASALASSGPDDHLDAILAGDAHDVIAELEPIPPGRRTSEQELLLGHAYAAVLDDERALNRYRRAVTSGGFDARVLGYLLGRLNASAPDDELDLLVLWPDPAVEDVISQLLLDPQPLVRANAAAVLIERGALGRIDVEQVAILDLQSGGCVARRNALAVLRAVGSSSEAEDALEGIARMGSGCFNPGEIRAAADAVSRRR